MEKARLEFPFDKCNNHQVKTEGFNEQITESFNQKGDGHGIDEEISQAELRIHDTDLKVCSLIKVIRDGLDKIREASERLRR